MVLPLHSPAPLAGSRKWIRWGFIEALFRTISMTLGKVVGGLASTFAHVTLSTCVIGGVQATVAGTILLYQRITPWCGKRLVTGSVLFGAGAFVGTMLPFIAFMQGAPLAVYTFLTLLAVIPGAVLDRAWFGERLVFRQMVGIMVALFAGWLVLEAPNITELFALPLWMLLGLLNAGILALNQGVTRWVKDINPWVKNFWGGLTTCTLGVCTLFYLGDARFLSMPETQPLLALSSVIAFVVIGMWTFNVIAYRDGATIPAKYILVNGMFLALVFVIGFLVFGESISLTQVIGMAVYFCGFVLVNRDGWRLFVRRT